MNKILVIEDDISIAELERDYLEISGFEVELCQNGNQALDLALKNDYDLIILDIILPYFDGFEILKKVREKKDIPIIIVSAKNEDIDKVRAFGLLVDDYITKPFSPSELVARTKAHILRYKRIITKVKEKTEVINIRGIKIDKASRTVSVNNVEKFFTAKEFDLLCFMVSNPNRVLSKEELFKEVWNMESLGDIATVTVHIKKIREKIELYPQKPQYIETIWGVGYRFKL